MNKVSSALTLLSGIALAGVLAMPAQAANLITNGDFEMGNTGFTSDYGFVTIVDQNSMYPESIYAVDKDPNLGHNLWASYGDHTSGTGLMMIVNGATSADMMVWGQDVAVAMNTDYVFSGWIASSYSGSPADLDIAINGSSLGSILSSTTTGEWLPFSVAWNSGANTLASLKLTDKNIDAGGNDFTIDDLKMEAAGAVPEPGAVASLLGMGVVGAGLLLRRRK